MPLVRYQSPDDPAFVVFDKARFRVEPSAFALHVPPIRQALGALLAARDGWNLGVMKLVEEDRRIRACLEWLDSLKGDDDVLITPELVYEPALDLVADALIADGHYAIAECPACPAAYPPSEVTREPWEFEEDGVALRGRRSTCPNGHTLHVLTDMIDGLDLEGDEETVGWAEP